MDGGRHGHLLQQSKPSTCRAAYAFLCIWYGTQCGSLCVNMWVDMCGSVCVCVGERACVRVCGSVFAYMWGSVCVRVGVCVKFECVVL